MNNIEIANRNVFSRQESLKEYSQFYLYPVEERIISKHFDVPGRLLELGCGCGRITINLKGSNQRVVAIDIVPEMLDIARKFVEGVEFKLMNACKLEFDSESFDYAIFAYNGIDYIYPEMKREICLDEIYRVLKPGGIFALSTHNCLCIKNYLPTNRFRLSNLILNIRDNRIFKQYRLERHPDGNLETYVTTPTRQKKQLKDHGFKKVRVYGQKHDNLFFTTFMDTWSYYVCFK
ncbi:MAG: class I SAM-dependent methyltransferase [Planctomycetes bacterium]|nr:class I SAM-dependent methyltransferase [Planctomycetota bacterium]